LGAVWAKDAGPVASKSVAIRHPVACTGHAHPKVISGFIYANLLEIDQAACGQCVLTEQLVTRPIIATPTAGDRASVRTHRRRLRDYPKI
jgi:hypothetical protein